MTGANLKIAEWYQFETCLEARLASPFVLPGATWNAYEDFRQQTLLHGCTASFVDGPLDDQFTAPEAQMRALAPHVLVTLSDEGVDRTLYQTHLDRLLSSPLEERVDRLEKWFEALLNEKGREAAKRLGADLDEEESSLDSKRFSPPFMVQFGSRIRVRLEVQQGAPRLTQPAIIRIRLIGLKKRELR